jgi:hypothetical protein
VPVVVVGIIGLNRWMNEQMYTVCYFDGGTEYSTVLVTIVKVHTEMDFKKKALCYSSFIRDSISKMLL